MATSRPPVEQADLPAAECNRQLRLLTSALDASPDHVLVTDREGLVVFANKALADRHGIARDELPGKPASCILPPELNDEELQRIRQAYRDEKPLDVVARGMRDDRTVIWVRLNITPIPEPHGRARYFLCVGTDVTAQMEDSRIKNELRNRIADQEQERERMLLELRLSQKLESVGRLAAGIAHEVNTPTQYVSDTLAFLSSAFEELMAQAQTNDNAQRESSPGESNIPFLLKEVPLALQRAQEGIDRVAAIVRAMKEFSHPGTSEFVLTDVRRLLDNTLEIARSEYRHIARIQRNYADVPLVPCHPGEINQVLINLIVNAAHAIEERGLDQSEGVITLRSATRGATVSITVSDNGCGIKPEHLDRIYDPFFTTKDVGKGSGQGLALARAIVVTRHGGSLDVVSTPGAGTRVTVRLPLTVATQAADKLMASSP